MGWAAAVAVVDDGWRCSYSAAVATWIAGINNVGVTFYRLRFLEIISGHLFNPSVLKPADR
jgi:hypothetical protein